MAKMKCELCESEEIIKEGENFVCKNCGCQYTLEQAKKLIGIQTPNTQNAPNPLDNLYVLARRAISSKEYRDARSYYSQILKSNPNDWEAVFYSELATGWIEQESMDAPGRVVYHMGKKRELIYNVIKEGYSDKSTQLEKINKVVAELIILKEDYHDHYEQSPAIGYRLLSKTTLYSCWLSLGEMMWDYGDNIIETFGDVAAFREPILNLWKLGVELSAEYLDYVYWHPDEFSDTDKKTTMKNNAAIIRRYVNKIGALDSRYYSPTIYDTPRKKTGCYIATCVYGSYDCGEVWTLRRYRDNVLATKRAGRAFIKLYYAVSPIVVKLFGKKKWFHKMWKKKLDKKVKKLQAQGIENTPYEDIDW